MKIGFIPSSLAVRVELVPRHNKFTVVAFSLRRGKASQGPGTLSLAMGPGGSLRPAAALHAAALLGGGG